MRYRLQLENNIKSNLKGTECTSVNWVLSDWEQALMAGHCENYKEYFGSTERKGRCRWPRGLRHSSAAACMLGLWFRIPPRGRAGCRFWMLYVVRYRSLRRTDHSSRGVLPRARVRACVCVSLSVNRCNSNPLHLKWVRTRNQTKKQTNKESARWILFDQISASEVTCR